MEGRVGVMFFEIFMQRLGLSTASIEIRVLPFGRQWNSHDEARFGHVMQSLGGRTDPVEDAVVCVEEARGLYR